VISTLTNITALVEGGGEITLGHLDATGKCVATGHRRRAVPGHARAPQG
jgi:hypothetical protein